MSCEPHRVTSRQLNKPCKIHTAEKDSHPYDLYIKVQFCFYQCEAGYSHLADEMMNVAISQM